MIRERVDERLGRSINDYLNHYILVVDAKAAATAAASLVVVGFVVSPAAEALHAPWTQIGGALALLAALAAASALYPRTVRLKGHLFWFDICSFGSPTEYWKSLASLDEDAIGLEYARQNFIVSGVLVRKTRRVQLALWLVGLASLVLGIAYAATPQQSG